MDRPLSAALPRLATARLVLRPVAPADLDALVALDADPEVMRFITGGAPTPVEEARAMLEHWLGLPARSPGYGFWAAEDATAHAFLGWFHLRVGEPADDPELGYRLQRPAWGRGLATEGSLALLEHGFATMGAGRIVAQTMAVNTRSRAVMARCGMRLVRTFRADWPVAIPGDEHGDVEYAIAREQWLHRVASADRVGLR